jgi:acyl-coenzyme A thioesterase PaaI-like protein
LSPPRPPSSLTGCEAEVGGRTIDIGKGNELTLPAHELTMTVCMTPDMANFSGNGHGGTVLKFLDQVAYACSSRYAGRYGQSFLSQVRLVDRLN